MAWACGSGCVEALVFVAGVNRLLYLASALADGGAPRGCLVLWRMRCFLPPQLLPCDAPIQAARGGTALGVGHTPRAAWVS